MNYERAMPSGTTKAQIARRLVDVLEFFDKDHPEVTVTELVRRFDWPQSSTSELLTMLVELGLLYKDRSSRIYWLTPRAALLGSNVQPGMVRDGRLNALMDSLTAQTGLGVGIFGMVELSAQVYSWCPGRRKLRCVKAAQSGIRGGEQEHLYNSAAGLLLLSTVPQPKRESMIRHMNAEAEPEQRFAVADLSARVQQCRVQGYATGEAGFGMIADVTAVLLPGLPESRPLAIGFAYERSDQIDAKKLLSTLQNAIARSIAESAPDIVDARRLLSGA